MRTGSSLLLIALFSSQPLEATDETRLPFFGQPLSFSWGVMTDFVIDDLMSVGRNDKHVDDTVVNSIMGTVTLSLGDRVDIRAALGTCKTVAETSLSTLYSSGTFRNSRLILNFDTTFAWDIDIDVVLFDWKNFEFTFDVDYFNSKPRLEYVVDEFNSVTHYIDLNSNFKSWTITLQGTYDIELSPSFTFSPSLSMGYGADYIDIKRYYLDLDGATTILISSLVSPPAPGFTLGMTLSSGEKWSISAQLTELLYKGYGITFNCPF